MHILLFLLTQNALALNLELLEYKNQNFRKQVGTSLAVQSLRLRTSTAVGGGGWRGFIPGRETDSHMPRGEGQKKRESCKTK